MSAGRSQPLRRDRRARDLEERRSHKRAAIRSRSRPGLGIGRISLIAVVAGLVVVLALAVTNRTAPTDAAPVVPGAAPVGVPASGFELGRQDAPVTIDLFEDFQCPACQRWGRDVLPTLARNEVAAGGARVVFHSFAFLGPESGDAARAGWAAQQQGRFWDMWATLYANQGLRENAGAFARARLLAMAEAIGLDTARFGVDLDSPAAAAFVATGVQDATHAAVDSTPTLLINGRRFGGSGYADLKADIEAAAAAT